MLKHDRDLMVLCLTEELGGYVDHSMVHNLNRTHRELEREVALFIAANEARLAESLGRHGGHWERWTSAHLEEALTVVARRLSYMKETKKGLFYNENSPS